ncbi:MAG: Trk family potassium uptake protein, partial [Clostridiales bacterium]|nr:Trk family potassium uptake protein [Clostridiales bacterium]
MKPFKKRKFKLSIWQYLALGYLMIIILGGILLILPFATRDGQSTTFLNALFTATSATCVTGLAPYDTATHWSIFGQIVILLLIQLGGLGFTTFVSVLFLMIRRGLGVYERKVMMQSYGENALKGVGKLIKRIVVGSFTIEIVGALLLMIRFIPDFGALKGIYFSVFHAVSAFCNAGFDLMGKAYGQFSSLTPYAGDPLVTIVISLLIIVGGLGFCVWGDVIDCKFKVKKFHLYTKMVLLVSSILLVLSTALYVILEWNVSCAGLSFGEKLLRSLFNASTSRTAGFYTTDPSTLSESGYLLTIVLMFIGGSSGSTAGGIKVSTFAVIIMGMMAAFRGRKDIN